MAATSGRYMTWGSNAYNRLITGFVDELQRDGLLGAENTAQFKGLCRCLACLPQPATFDASTLDQRDRVPDPQEMCVDTDEVRALFREYREAVGEKRKAGE